MSANVLAMQAVAANWAAWPKLRRAGIHLEGPPPLCIDGHAYHRKQQARRKRR